MILAPSTPPPAAAPPWVEQPSPTDLARAWSIYGDANKIVTQAMDCGVRADGRLESCEGVEGSEPQPLLSLSGRYRLDRSRYPNLRVRVTAELPKLYDAGPKLVKQPKRETLLAYAPAGVVSLHCRLTVDGEAADCIPGPGQKETPEAIAGALRAAPLFRFKPAQLAGRPVEVYDRFAVTFSAVTYPDWIRKPDFNSLMAVWPREGVGMDGFARIKCQVGQGGVMQDCRVRSENPPGKGFGAAALLLAPTFLMKPGTRDGVPVYGLSVTIPVSFKGGAAALLSGPTESVLNWAPYVAAPSAEAVMAAYPARALAAGVAGKVALRCGVSKEGGLQRCDSLLEEPRGQGFGAAAERLVSSFKVDMTALPKGPLDSLRAPVTFDFSREGLSPERRLRGIDWVKRISAEKLVEIYPPAALEAKVMKGGARVGCTIGPDGALTGCTVRDETPPRLGFGETALAVAAVMKANLWTRDGAPAAGAEIVIPVTLVYGGEPPPPEPAK